MIRTFTVLKNEKNEQRSRDAAAKKRANTSGVGKINNYCEDIYIPPYNNTPPSESQVSRETADARPASKRAKKNYATYSPEDRSKIERYAA